MRRLLITILLTSSAARATSTTFTSCSAGAITQTGVTHCLLQGSNYLVTAFAQAPFPENPTPIVSAYASLEAGLSGLPRLQISAMADASETETLYTTGASRPGFIQFDIQMFNPAAGSADAILTDGVHRYSFSCSPGSLEGCAYRQTMPFDLGSHFQAFVSGSVLVSGLFDPGESAFGAPSAAVQSIRLFEADGTTPVSFTAVPEPSTWELLLIVSSVAVAMKLTLLSRRWPSNV